MHPSASDLTDDIFDDFENGPLNLKWEHVKFKFNQGDEIKFDNTSFAVYDVTENYVTIYILKKRITAKLMEFMELRYNAIYHGPIIDWGDSQVHVTFKRKVA